MQHVTELQLGHLYMKGSILIILIILYLDHNQLMVLGQVAYDKLFDLVWETSENLKESTWTC